MAFVEVWLQQSFNTEEMDRNDGLPPEKWIEMAKEAVKRVYSCANGQLQKLLYVLGCHGCLFFICLGFFFKSLIH